MASLHIHPPKAGLPLRAVDTIHFVEGRGIEEDKRYFGRTSRSTGKPSRRQVTLIEREVIGEHAAAFGLQAIPPGNVRSNVETTGIDLQALVGCEVQVGEAVVRCYEARTPCDKMDALIPGLRDAMEDGRQGVLAYVVRSGVVRVGDEIRAVPLSTTVSTSR